MKSIINSNLVESLSIGMKGYVRSSPVKSLKNSYNCYIVVNYTCNRFQKGSARLINEIINKDNPIITIKSDKTCLYRDIVLEVWSGLRKIYRCTIHADIYVFYDEKTQFNFSNVIDRYESSEYHGPVFSTQKGNPAMRYLLQ